MLPHAGLPYACFSQFGVDTGTHTMSMNTLVKMLMLKRFVKNVNEVVCSPASLLRVPVGRQLHRVVQLRRRVLERLLVRPEPVLPPVRPRSVR